MDKNIKINIVDMYMSNTYQLIVAVDSKNGIAKNKVIPWHIPDDLAFFREITQKSIVVMGRHTYFSIPKRFRPLENRVNVVCTQNPELYYGLEVSVDNLLFMRDFMEYESNIHNQQIFIAGGSQIYNLYYPKCNIIWLTRIKKDYECDMILNTEEILSEFIKIGTLKETDEYVIEKYIRITTTSHTYLHEQKNPPQK